MVTKDDACKLGRDGPAGGSLLELNFMTRVLTRCLRPGNKAQSSAGCLAGGMTEVIKSRRAKFQMFE